MYSIQKVVGVVNHALILVPRTVLLLVGSFARMIVWDVAKEVA